jgi:hypothetical protein
MIAAPGRPRGVEAYRAVLRQYGRDALDAEFGGFLDDNIHTLSARNALDKVQPQFGLTACIFRVNETAIHDQFDVFPGKDLELGGVFAVTAVEHADSIAGPKPEYTTEVLSLVTVESNN